MPAELSGLDAILQFTFDAAFKPTGQRQRMTEMALYTVKDGKIVRQQFFYNVPGSKRGREVPAVGYRLWTVSLT